MEESDLSLTCRLCTSNLLDFPECYSIIEDLEELIFTLTTIKFDHLVDKSNLRICINCYERINNFNEFKQNAIEIHEKLKELDLATFYISEELESDKQYKMEALSEDNDLEEAIIEYIDPEDEEEVIGDLIMDSIADETMSQDKYTPKKETDYAVERILEEIDDNSYLIDKAETEAEVEKFPVKRTTKKLDASNEKEKGKEIYQKLLQKCYVCGKLIEKNRLEGHINKHNNIRPYKCNECEKTFYCKQLLRLHRTSIHTNIKVKCEQCDKYFPSARALYAHTLRHKNQDRYVCDLCDKKFNNSNSLKRHLAIHSGVREFVCTTCGVGFYRKFNLDVHVKNVHHQTKEFSCNIDGCKKSFGYSRLLKDHIKKNHHDQKYDNLVEY